MAAELAQRSGHDGPLWPVMVHVHVRESQDISFHAEMAEQQSEWKNGGGGGGGRPTISSLWLRFPHHIFRQKKHCWFVDKHLCGRHVHGDHGGEFTHHGDKSLRRPAKFSSAEEEKRV